jgi:pyruvate formate lyase activating enzyme
LADGESVAADEALAFIAGRRHLISGVVFSGGEPLLRTDLPEWTAAVKALGLSVKIDTNGTLPDELAALCAEAEPDYVAIDLKLAPRRYGEIGGGRDWAGLLERSAAVLRSAGVDHEFRSLALPSGFFGPDDVAALAPLVGDALWRFGRFRPGACLEAAWNDYPECGRDEAEALASTARALGVDGRASG